MYKNLQKNEKYINKKVSIKYITCQKVELNW